MIYEFKNNYDFLAHLNIFLSFLVSTYLCDVTLTSQVTSLSDITNAIDAFTSDVTVTSSVWDLHQTRTQPPLSIQVGVC